RLQLERGHFSTILLIAGPFIDEEIVFDLIKQDPFRERTPAIVACKSSSVEEKTRFYALGATDVVTRPIQIDELMLQINHAISRSSSFEEMVFRDPLTKAYNRRYFEHQVKLEVQKAKQTKMAVSLVFIDLDRFKSINDTHGHDAGDEVLIKVVERITENTCDTDILARYGGEEFVMILPHSTMQSAAEKVEL